MDQMSAAGSQRHAGIVTVMVVATTLLPGCAEDLILDLNKGDSIRLVGLADNFPCDDPKYAKVKKIKTVELRFFDGSSQSLCTRDPSQGPPRSAQHIREDCDKLVKQDVYRKVRLSGLYWPGARERKFWTFEIVSRVLFESGLSFVEVPTSNYIGHELSVVPQKLVYRDPARPYLRIQFADASSEFCAPFDYLIKTKPRELISLVSRGLRPGQCIAIEPIPTPTAQFEIETTSKEHSGVKYVREKLLDRQDRTVAAEYLVIDSCANNSRAFKGFPWTAIEVVPTPNAPISRQTFRTQQPVFPTTRTVTLVSETVSTPIDKAFLEREDQKNAIADGGAISIVSHSSLQIIDGSRQLVIPLGRIEGGQFSYAVVRKSKDGIFVLGHQHSPARTVAILHFSHLGEPLRADLVPLPGTVLRSWQQRYYDLDVGPSNYDIHVHLLTPDDPTRKVTSTVTLNVKMD